MKKSLILSSLPIMVLASSWAHGDTFSDLKPYAGLEAQWRHTDFQKNQGHNLFKTDLPQGNAFLGIHINDFLGLEAGYESSTKRHHTVKLPAGALVNFRPLDTNTTYTSTAKIQGAHISLVGRMPVSDDHRLNIIGLAGVAHLKSHLTYRVLSAYDPAARAMVAQATNAGTFKKTKNVLRLGLGIEHFINEHWGVRATYLWENTHRIKASSTSAVRGISSTLQLRNTSVYSLGAFYRF